MNIFYTYAYLTEENRPYYIGKGKGNRLYDHRGKNCNPPKDKSKIIILKKNLTEQEAFKHEIYMISVLGKKCNRTGILMNIADGGNAPPIFYGDQHPSKRPEVRKKISNSLKGKKRNPVSLQTRKKISKAHIKRLKNNPRPLDFYSNNILKMAQRNKTDKQKHKNHSEFMKNKTYAAKTIEFNNKKYNSMTEAIQKTGLSRYLILKKGGKFIKNIK